MTLEQRAVSATRQGGTPPFTLLVDLAREVDALKEQSMRPDPPAPNTENTGRTGKYRRSSPEIVRDVRLVAIGAPLGGAVVLVLEAVLTWLI